MQHYHVIWIFWSDTKLFYRRFSSWCAFSPAFLLWFWNSDMNKATLQKARASLNIQIASCSYSFHNMLDRMANLYSWCVVNLLIHENGLLVLKWGIISNIPYSRCLAVEPLQLLLLISENSGPKKTQDEKCKRNLIKIDNLHVLGNQKYFWFPLLHLVQLSL